MLFRSYTTCTSFVGKIRSSTPSKIVQLDKPAEFQSFSLLPAEARPSEIHVQRKRFFLAERRRHVAGSLKPSGPGKTFKPSKSHIAEQFEESAKKSSKRFLNFWLFLENLQMSNQNNFSTLQASKLGSSTGHGRSDVGEATFVALTSCGLRYTTSSTAQVVFV